MQSGSVGVQNLDRPVLNIGIKRGLNQPTLPLCMKRPVVMSETCQKYISPFCPKCVIKLGPKSWGGLKNDID